MTIRPDGRLYVQSGVGNLGTHSVFDLARVAADVLALPWEKVEVMWGDTSKHLPYSCLSVGSQTTHAMTRANHAAAMDAQKKLQEIAARDLGGNPDDYELGGERVFRRGNPGGGLTYAQAATGDRAGWPLRRARNAGGHPSDDESCGYRTAGLGLMGVAKDGISTTAPPTRSSPGSRKSKSISKPGNPRSSTTSAWPTSGRSSTRAAWRRRSPAAVAWGSATR